MKAARFLAAALLLALCPSSGSRAAATVAAPAGIDLRYDFGSRPAPGWTRVRPDRDYSPGSGFGFDLGSRVEAAGDFAAGRDGGAFFFSVRLGPGAYRVTVALAGAPGGSVTTVKSETRRLMLESIRVPEGRTELHAFLVHVRVPRLPGGGSVRLKEREREPILYVQWDPRDARTRIPFTELDWDGKLTLEFSGTRPAVRAVEIVPAARPIAVYLIGDSTVTDQMMEPWAAWGQMLPRWFRPPVLVADYAESGETAAAFLGERRWAKVMSELRSGDYVLMQFGINDRKAVAVPRFKACLVRFITDARGRGATPVLVTSQNLRKLDPRGRAVQTLGGYPEAMREVARERNVALIDLNRMSETLYESIGPARLPRMFVDGTHQDDYGAYELAKCVVEGALAAKLPFARYLAGDWKAFDPARPDPMDGFRLPADPQLDPARPGGPGAPGGRGPMAGALPK